MNSEVIDHRALTVIEAFERGRKDARYRKHISSVPYRDKACTEAWERGYKYEREKLWRGVK